METVGDTQKSVQETGNTKTVSSRGWTITLNNYTPEEYIKLETYATGKTKYIIGKEVGENGTPHLQGYIYNKSAIRLETLKKICPRGHFEKARGTANDNYTYCSKDNNFKSNYDNDTFQEKIKKKLLLKYNNMIWKEWQKNILTILDKPADNRKINVFIDENGNSGKSFITKFIYLTMEGVIICDGKKDNIFNNIKTNLDNEIEPKIVILDIPRSGQECINYGVIEKIKDGLLYSGKYEGGTCIFDNVHLLIFTNSDLNYEKMSKDRWNINYI